MLVRAAIAAALVGAIVPASARADRIYKWTDSEGVLHVTNVPKDAKGHRGKPQADPDFKAFKPGAPASLDFVPNDVTAKFDPYIQEACAKYSIPPALVRAIMNQESNFDPKAVSNKGAVGLMQLMRSTGEDMAVTNFTDPRENILGGVRYLRQLTNEFDGDMIRVIAAYNAGPKAVWDAGGVPKIPETQDYVRRVLALYFRYKGAAPSVAR